MISDSVQPLARRSITNSTARRVPLIAGFPTRILGSRDMRSCQFIRLYDGALPGGHRGGGGGAGPGERSEGGGGGEEAVGGGLTGVFRFVSVVSSSLCVLCGSVVENVVSHWR